MLTLVSHLGYEIFRSAGRELYRCVYRACIVRICAESRSLPIRIDTLRYTHDTLPIRLGGKSTPIQGENGTPSRLTVVHNADTEAFGAPYETGEITILIYLSRHFGGGFGGAP
jgi:hypothetical protein